MHRHACPLLDISGASSLSLLPKLAIYRPELPLELEPEVPPLLLPVPPAPVFEVGLPNMVRSDVFLLGAKTELKSLPIPCMVLHPVRLIPNKVSARSLENMISLQFELQSYQT